MSKLVVSVVTVLFLATAALAANIHFLSASDAASGDNLLVKFRIAGVGNGQITVTVNATATAEYACINNGGKNPKAANKHSVVADVSASGTFKSDKNGNVTGSLTVSPPPNHLTGPPGMHDVLLSVTYEDVTVSAGGASQSLDDVSAP
jgi:hypothetical protein